MSLNPDRTKPAHEVIFSKKTKKTLFTLNNMPIINTTSQKHMGLNLDARLTFNNHINEKIGKAIKVVHLFHKLQCLLPHLSTYKSFIIQHMDYGDVIYDQLSNATFSGKIKSVQYNAALAITSAIRGSFYKNSIK